MKLHSDTNDFILDNTSTTHMFMFMFMYKGICLCLSLCIRDVYIDILDILPEMEKLRNTHRYTSFPIPSTRSSKVPIPAVEYSPLDIYQSYPMPELLWKKFISVYQETRNKDLVTTPCFEILPATEAELSLFPTDLSNDSLREFLFKKMSSERKMTGGWDYRERNVISVKESGASMFEPLQCYSPTSMELLSVRTIFTKSTIKAFNQVCHDIAFNHLI